MNPTEIPLLSDTPGNIPLFMPHVPKGAGAAILDTLGTRWLGQGPKVEEFETRFSEEFCGSGPVIAVGSGTDALHLAYLAAGIQPGDEVITPVFTCTATNIPLLYIGATPIFADVEIDTLNIEVSSIEPLITEKTKAIVCVHYGGLPCKMNEIASIAKKHNLVVIEDAAHAVGAKYHGQPVGSISDFTMFSFQAIKHITTGDGGLLAFKNRDILALAKRLRWFGIDRLSKQMGIWENDIKEVGYKYQMTDISASLGLAALTEFSDTLSYRRSLLEIYCKELIEHDRLSILSKETPETLHAAWLFTVRVKERIKLQTFLASNGVESNQVHYRNDRYSIFGDRKSKLPNMDLIENEYLVLPLHTRMTTSDVSKICGLINNFYKVN
jgi:perosamine synthetase